jgi:hypothetical protein
MDARFVARTTSFGWAKFSGELTYFGKAQFLGESADFRAAEFVGRNTVFDRTAFCARLTDFQWSKFCGQKAEFNNVEFKNVVRFDTTALEAKTRFTGTDLTKCGFVAVDLKNVEFSLLDWDWKDKLSNETQPELIFRELSPQTPTVEGVRVALGIQRSAVETRKAKMRARLKTSEIYSQLKVQFHNKRDFTKAGMFHFRGQECKRMACMLPKDFFKWVFLWILKLSCGYGEKLRNVGLASFALVLAFAAAYTSLGLHDVSDGSISRNFGTCLIFSIKGFFPLWRFQQYKLVGDFANLIAGLEFILGAFMVGLFIYVFRRRMEK